MRYAGTSDLVWQADARVSVFQSGLILVQRSAIVRKDRAATARASLIVGDVLPLESDPSLDGVFVYPEPQETYSESHVTFIVSGYGRASTRKIATSSVYVATFDLTDFVGFSRELLGEKISTFQVIRKDEPLVLEYPSEEPEFQYPDGTGTLYISGGWKVASIDRVNFGEFDELSISYIAKYP